MTRGPRPMPTALRVLHGGKPGSGYEPTPDAGIPACPEHLSDIAREEWERITPELHKLGLLTRIDRAALAAYCQSWGRLVEAETEIADLGEVIKSPSGYPIQNPWLSIANGAMKQMKGFLTEFGLSPAARTRIKVDTPPPPSKLDKYVERRVR